jgi:hypothetical protein
MATIIITKGKIGVSNLKCPKNYFFREGVITFTSIGYNFKSSSKHCHQLSWNLCRDAHHPDYIKKLKRNWY